MSARRARALLAVLTVVVAALATREVLAVEGARPDLVWWTTPALETDTRPGATAEHRPQPGPSR